MMRLARRASLFIASSVLTSAALSARVGMKAQSWPVTAPGASLGPSLMTGVPA